MNWEEYHQKYYGKEYEPEKNNIIIKLIQFYQYRLSWLFKGSCRFNPSCSEYMVISLRKYGIFKGLCKGFWRIIRCNPFCKGGIDEP